jgi:undecaprenyl-diphosphatase
MDFIQAFVLSVVEGVTEFLPVSSTGHQILAAQLINLTQTDFVKTFEVVIQMGAILSVAVLYWQRLLKDFETLKRVIWVFLPTAVIGFLAYKVVKEVLLGNSMVTAISLLIGGILIIIFERYFKQNEGKLKIDELSMKSSLILGTIQAISVIPGVSRAAATIFGGMFLGLKREQATELSFLVAFPVIGAASVYDLYKSRDTLVGSDLTILLFGLVVSFIVSLFVIKWLLGYVKKHDLTYFGVYRVILAIIFLIFVR